MKRILSGMQPTYQLHLGKLSRGIEKLGRFTKRRT
jgi:tryptophanyl-tRNA synthetase